METSTLIAIVLGTTGAWTFLSFLMKQWLDRKHQRMQVNLGHAETRHKDVQAENILLDNWIQWSQQLETRVKELEDVNLQNRELNRKVESQRKRIFCLEKKVERLTDENERLRDELLKIKGSHGEE